MMLSLFIWAKIWKRADNLSQFNPKNQNQNLLKELSILLTSVFLPCLFYSATLLSPPRGKPAKQARSSFFTTKSFLNYVLSESKRLLWFQMIAWVFSPNKSQSFIMYFFFVSNMILKYKLIFVIHEYHLLVLSLCFFLYVNLSKTFALTLSKFQLKRISLLL